MSPSVSAAAAAAVNFVEVQANGAAGVNGLGGVSGLAVSPDGRYLYGVGATDDAVVVFQRDPATGRLIYIESRREGDQQAGDTGPISGLTTPLRTALSPDGLQLYTISGQDGAVAVFSRDSATGRLTYQQTIAASGVTLARAMGFSPDGAYLYVAGDDSGSTGRLEVFKRDALSSDLTFVGAYSNHTAGIDGMGGAAAVVVSPDGQHVYVSGTADDGIAVFSRDAAGGSLSFIAAVKNGIGGVSGLQKPGQLALSADGRHVYVSASGSDDIVVFARDTATGKLSFIQALANSQPDDLGVPVAGLDGVYGIAVSPEGSHVYATGDVDQALVVWRRDPVTGRLSFAEELQNNLPGVDGLSKVLDVAVSPDGQNLYTAAADQSKVGVFGINAANLGLVMTADAAIANAGAPLGYTLTVANNGPSDATNVVMTDELPAALSYVSAVPSQGTCSHVNNAVTCRLTALPAGATATVTLRATVGSAAAVSNEARVAGDQRDPQPDDNHAGVTVAVNTPPTAKDDSAKTNEDIPVTINVLANDSDADQDPLTVANAVSPSAKGGTVSVNGDGTITYIPASGYTGADSFHYTVGDGRGGSAVAKVDIKVNTPPVANDDNVSILHDTTATIYVLANDNDIDGDSFVITAVSNPSTNNGAVVNNGDTVSYTPPGGFTGTDTFTYTITDANGAGSSATVSVQVQASTAAPTGSSDSGDKAKGGGASGGGGAIDLPALLLLGSFCMWKLRLIRRDKPPAVPLVI